MGITDEDVLHVAKLARLELTGDELQSMTTELRQILGHIEELTEVNTDGVEATAHLAVLQMPTRPDAVHAQLSAETALRESPRATPEGFAVPGFVSDP